MPPALLRGQAVASRVDAVAAVGIQILTLITLVSMSAGAVLYCQNPESSAAIILTLCI